VAKNPELLKRIASALVLMPVAIACLYYGKVAWLALVMGGSAAAAWEYARLIEGAGTPRWLSWATLMGCVAAMSAMVLANVNFALAAVVFCAASIYGPARKEGLQRPFECAFGIPYVALTGIVMIGLRADAERGLWLLAYLFAAVWATDTFAYFGGRAIGGPKIWPAVSPKKTWAGLCSGVLGAALCCGLIARQGGASQPIVAVGFAMVLAVIAQAGDFYESHLKRRIGVKDSGSLIPGHGGMLDRIDGLLAAAPALGLFDVTLGGWLSWW
jgi:phosphatidate cytidylyltransferase